MTLLGSLWFALSLVCIALLGCSDDDRRPFDGGTMNPDSSGMDGNVPDAWGSMEDGSTTMEDAVTAMDAQMSRDAFVPMVDASTEDAWDGGGFADAGAMDAPGDVMTSTDAGTDSTVGSVNNRVCTDEDMEMWRAAGGMTFILDNRACASCLSVSREIAYTTDWSQTIHMCDPTMITGPACELSTGLAVTSCVRNVCREGDGVSLSSCMRGCAETYGRERQQCAACIYAAAAWRAPSSVMGRDARYAWAADWCSQ